MLMAHLPPGGYPNFATKQDLLELEPPPLDLRIPRERDIHMS